MSQLRVNLQDLDDNGLLGDWAFSDGDTYIFIRLPRPGVDRGEVTAEGLKLSVISLPNEENWQWDGNREAPTLSPSINWVGVWHGWMRAGKLE